MEPGDQLEFRLASRKFNKFVSAAGINECFYFNHCTFPDAKSVIYNPWRLPRKIRLKMVKLVPDSETFYANFMKKVTMLEVEYCEGFLDEREVFFLLQFCPNLKELIVWHTKNVEYPAILPIEESHINVFKGLKKLVIDSKNFVREHYSPIILQGLTHMKSLEYLIIHELSAFNLHVRMKVQLFVKQKGLQLKEFSGFNLRLMEKFEPRYLNLNNISIQTNVHDLYKWAKFFETQKNLKTLRMDILCENAPFQVSLAEQLKFLSSDHFMNLKVLDLHSDQDFQQLQLEGLSLIQNMVHLEELSIQTRIWQIFKPKFNASDGLKVYPKVRTLKIDMRYVYTDCFIKIFKAFPNVKNLEIKEMYMEKMESDFMFKHLDLQQLTIKECRIKQDNLELLGLQKNLKYLDLSKNSSIFNITNELKNLRSLNVGETGIFSVDSIVKNCKILEKLAMDSQYFEAESIKKLGLNLQRLKHLILKNCSDINILQINDWKYFRCLKILDVDTWEKLTVEIMCNLFECIPTMCLFKVRSFALTRLEYEEMIKDPLRKDLLLKLNGFY